MRRAVGLALSVMLLAGCVGAKNEINRVLMLREKLISAEGCSFTGKITADYGDLTQSFTVDCASMSQGELHFTIREPEPISGIQGNIQKDAADICYEKVSAAFPLLAEGRLSPAAVPWVFVKSLRSGYISWADPEGELLHACLMDSYEDKAFQVDVWIDPENRPVRCEVLWEGVRVAAMTIEDYALAGE